MSLYADTAGAYARYRAEDPRIAALIHAALGDARSVVNVGAGQGAYEPRDREVTAVEPEPAMIAARATPAVQAYAEDLPFADASFDAGMAVLTVHHWRDWRAGLAELRRVVRDRVVIFSWDPTMARGLWLVDEYLPEVAAGGAQVPSPEALIEALGGGEIRTVPISHDCADGFMGAYWRRPERYLEPEATMAISGLAKLDPAVRERGLRALAEDLKSGTWAARHAALLARPDIDLGYRLLISRHTCGMSKTPRSLSGKVAVVTGGARGIGQAMARALAREGVLVAIGDLDAGAAQAAALELANGSIGLALDVTDRPGFTAFLDEVERTLGPIDILVNNAGIMHVTPLEEEGEASVTRQLEINLHAVIHGTQEAIRRMRPRDSGHIVNVASLAGRAAAPGLATYCATKHGVIGLSEAVRAELRGTGVEVTVVMPGFAKTELAAGVPDLRGVPRVSPDDIAAATVDALKVPRFDVWAPKRLAGVIALGAMVPRSWREAVSRAMNSSKVWDTDRAARAEYEARAAASAPTTEDEKLAVTP